MRTARRVPSSTGSSLAAIAIALAAAALPAPALAKRCVNPKGSGGCYAGLQDAIDAASPGETIFVRPGVYRDQVTVGKALLILGTGKTPGAVVVDGGGAGPTLFVAAADVKLRNLTVRNAGTNLVEIAGAGARLTRVILRGANDSCVRVSAADARIVSSRLSACGTGIVALGAGLQLRTSSLSGIVGHCLSVTGDGFRVLGTRIDTCTGSGIVAQGAGGLVDGVRIGNTGDDAITVVGPDFTLRGSSVHSSAGFGIRVDSSNPVVADTRVTDAQWCLRTSCFAGCTGGEIARNVLEGCRGLGVSVYHEGSAMTVADNRVTRALGVGVDIWGTSVFTVRGNRVTGVTGSCFQFMQLGSALVRDNVASGCKIDGFAVSGTSNTLRANRATGALWRGFHLFGSGHTLVRNVSRGNNFAFCDEGTATTLTGNTFTTSECP